MGTIIQFRRRQVKSDDAERVEAMVKGNIEVYTCNTCGEDFEVLNSRFPKTCPCCGVEIDEWRSEDEE